MKHIRFLGSNRTICETPEALGTDVVFPDDKPQDAERCKVCYQLLVAYNVKMDEEGLDIPDSIDDGATNWRQLIIGGVIMAGIWIVVVLILLAVFGV